MERTQAFENSAMADPSFIFNDNRPILPVAEKHLVVILRIRGAPPDMKSTLVDDQNLNFLPIIQTKMLLPDE